jgi:hypothetical protein
MITLLGLCLSLGLGAGLIGWGFFTGGFPLAGVLMFLFGMVCLVTQFKWQWAASLGFFFLSISAAFGLLFNYSVLLMFSGAVLQLAGWDLSAFHHHIRSSSNDDHRARLEQTHFSRLALVLGVGIGMSLLAGLLHLKINFEWGALLLVIGALGVSVLLRRLWRSD